MGIRKISRCRPRSGNNAELGHFTLSEFCRGRHRHVQRVNLFLWRSRCRRRRGLLKLHNFFGVPHTHDTWFEVLHPITNYSQLLASRVILSDNAGWYISTYKLVIFDVFPLLRVFDACMIESSRFLSLFSRFKRTLVWTRMSRRLFNAW